MSQEQNETTTITEELKELVYENRWYIKNQWTIEEQQEYAIRIADKLVAIANGDPVEPVAPAEPREDFTDIIPPDDFTAPEWLVDNDVMPIVGRRFTTGEFIEYVKWVKKNEAYTWEPEGITMHHTAYPDLALRPNGFTEQHMLNIRHGYINDKGWTHAPHIFTDNHGIWVFNPLSSRGTHAVSYNFTRYGIEMLGNFNNDHDYESERGKASCYNGKFAAAVLMKHADISTAKLNFHRHDPETSKSCPGSCINFSVFEKDVLEMVAKV